MRRRRFSYRPSRRVRPGSARVSTAALALLSAMGAAQAQTTFHETFTGTAAPGWVFGGVNSVNPSQIVRPLLTAATGSDGNGGGAPIDASGNGWLRLTQNLGNQSNYALLDTKIFSTNTQIQVEMEYAFWNGTGADGITFFLVDGAVGASNFVPGAYGGSMGYAQRQGVPGMPGGYLGFAFDNWGNYTNNSEGRNGGVSGPGVGGLNSTPTDATLRPNRIAVRGPASSNYAFIASSAELSTLPGGGQMDFPDAGRVNGQNTVGLAADRPGQTGADYRSFRLTLDAGNYLVVEMKFGANSNYIVAFERDLSGFARPETFKIGFTGATGGSNEIHEIRNLSVVSTPFATVAGSYEWDDGDGAGDSWGSTVGGETNANWFALTSGADNRTPLAGSDIFFGQRPSATTTGAPARPSPYASPQAVEVNNPVSVRSLNFNTRYDYALAGPGTITLGDADAANGTPSINVADIVSNPRFHRVGNPLSVLENLLVANQSASTLCLNGPVALGANRLTTMGQGHTHFNGVITGSGPLVVNGAPPNSRDSTGIVTLRGDNAATYTGAITVNGGQLVVLHSGALGNSSAGTTVNAGGTLGFRGGISTAEPLLIAGPGTELSPRIRAGAVYNDGGSNTLNGTVTLAGDAVLHSRAGNLTVAAALGEAVAGRSLAKTGDGVVTLASASAATYTGSTFVRGGALRVANPDALAGGFITDGQTGRALVLDGGVLEIAGATAFTRQVGLGADQVRWSGDGGFSASGGARTVTLANAAGSAGGQLAWGVDAGFVAADRALLLSSVHADSTVTFTNPLALGAAPREVRVAQGSAVVDAVLSGALGGAGGLVKTGEGTLQLGGANTYTGATEIRAGALRGNLPSGSNLVLNGGVREVGADYAGSLGGAGGQVRWTGDGGFSATGGARSLTLNAGATLTWGGAAPSADFVAAGNTLVLGSGSADGTVTLVNALALGGGAAETRRIRAVAGTNPAIAAGALSGVVSGSAALAVGGDGRLDLLAANTVTGAITVSGAELRLAGANGSLASASGYTVRGGGSLVLDNVSSLNTNRLSDGATLTLSAGNLSFLGSAGNNVAAIETLGRIHLAAGANTVAITANDDKKNTRNRLGAAGLDRGAGATVDFVSGGFGGLGGGADTFNPTLAFAADPTLERGILPYATVNGAAFAGYSPANGVVAVTGAHITQNAWTASTLAANTASQSLDADRVVGALLLGDGINVTETGGARGLTIETGGILATGAASTISTSTLRVGGAGSREVITHVHGSGGLTISSSIQDNGNTTGLTKSGAGALRLGGSTSNTHTGPTTVNAGLLDLAKTGGATAIAGNLTVGDGGGEDRVRLLGSEQIADTATVNLRGGTMLNNRNQAVLELKGFTETFATLNITGNSVIDFSGGEPCAPGFLIIDALTVAADAQLTLRNWIDAADYLLIRRSGLDSLAEQANIARVIFEGYGQAAWKAYSGDYFMLTPHLAPVPEPAGYGLLAVGGLLGFSLTRRRRRPRA